MNSEEVIPLWCKMFEVTDIMRNINISITDEMLFSLTFNQLRMIKNVHALNRDYPEGVTLKVLAESLAITPAAASEMVDALVRKDVLRRDHNPQDRRAVAISLADSCRKRFAEGEKNFENVTNEFLATLPAADRDSFISTVEKFRVFMQPYKK